MAAMIMRAQGLTKTFGGIRAVDGVDFDLVQGEIQALIGPNGAGKTTFVSLLSGRIPADAGQIFLGAKVITTMPAYARVRLGVAYTFQITSIFPGLSVFDNVALAAQSRGARELRAAVAEALQRVGLLEFSDKIANTLSYGHQRLLELAMGLALAPRLLILDEPTQGLAAGEIDRFVSLIRTLVPQMTVLLIEHNMEVVMDLADRITVLKAGRVLARGTPAEIQANVNVQAAYLGGSEIVAA